MQYLTQQAMATFLEESEPTLFGKPLSAAMRASLLNGDLAIPLEDGRSFRVAPGGIAQKAAPPAPEPVTVHGRPVTVTRAPSLVRNAMSAAAQAGKETNRHPTTQPRAPSLVRGALAAAARATDDDDGPRAA